MVDIKRSNDFVVSGHLYQPDGITPVPRDVIVIVTNSGLNSNNRIAFSTNCSVSGGNFNTDFSSVSPRPQYLAAEGDVIGIEVIDNYTGATLACTVTQQGTGIPGPEFTLIASDITCRDPDYNRGALYLDIVLTLQFNIGTTSLKLVGSVFQPDNTTRIDNGLLIKVLNTVSLEVVTGHIINGEFNVSFTGTGQNVAYVGTPLRLSVVNDIGTVYNQYGSLPYITRTATEDEISRAVIPYDFPSSHISLRLDAEYEAFVEPATPTVTENYNSIDINFLPVQHDQITSYRVYRSIFPSNVFLAGFTLQEEIAHVATATSYTFTDTNVTPGRVYRYEVRPVYNLTEEYRTGTKIVTAQTSTPQFSIKQTIAEEYKLYQAGRELTFSTYAYHVSGPTDNIVVTLLYKNNLDVLCSLQIGLLSVTSPTRQLYQLAKTLPDDVSEILEIYIGTSSLSFYKLDQVSISITGPTTDSIARTVISPSIYYICEEPVVALKNLKPGQLFLYNITAKTAKLLADISDLDQSVIDSVSETTGLEITIDPSPAEWSSDGTTLYYFHATGLNINAGPTVDVLSDLRALSVATPPAEGGQYDILGSNICGRRPRLLADDKTIVFLTNTIGATNTIYSVDITQFPPTLIAEPIDINGSITNFDMTKDQIGLVVYAGNLQRYRRGDTTTVYISDQENPEFIIGTSETQIIYLDGTDLYAKSFRDIEKSIIPYLLEFNTRNRLDGDYELYIRATDASPLQNTSQIRIFVTINNTLAQATLKASRISNVELPRHPIMEVGSSLATSAQIQFATLANLLLATLSDTLQTAPLLSTASTTIAGPFKMQFSWLINNGMSGDMLANSGGKVNKTILPVHTGIGITNIYIPEVEEVANNPFSLYIGADGSTYYDPYMLNPARLADGSVQIDVAPKLANLPTFTHDYRVFLSWSEYPGSPVRNIYQYKILRSSDTGRTYTEIYSTIDTENIREYVDVDTTIGATYFYKAQAIDEIGNTIESDPVYTIIDPYQAIEKLGYLDISYSLRDAVINEEPVYDARSGKIYMPGTTFALCPTANPNMPGINYNSTVLASFSYQQGEDIIMRFQPVVSVSSVDCALSGGLVPEENYIFEEDQGLARGSTSGKDHIKFLTEKRTVADEAITRSESEYDALGMLFATDIIQIYEEKYVTQEPAYPDAGFRFRISNSEPGRIIADTRQEILEIVTVKNVTQNISYDPTDATVDYTVTPPRVELDFSNNAVKYPLPQVTDVVQIDYKWKKIYADTTYELDRSVNSIRWLNTNIAPQADYYCTYKHLGPVPNEQIRITYSYNKAVRQLQFGDLETGFVGYTDQRGATADVLAKESEIVPVDVSVDLTLFEGVNSAYIQSRVSGIIADHITNTKLAQSVQASDIDFAIRQELDDVDNLEVDPFPHLGRTDMPKWLKITAEDTDNFVIEPGYVCGEATFYRKDPICEDILIPAGTVVSTELTPTSLPELFATQATVQLCAKNSSAYYNCEKGRYEIKIPICRIAKGAASVGVKAIKKIHGMLSRYLAVENETTIDSAQVTSEQIESNGTMTISVLKGNVLSVERVANLSAQATDNIPAKTIYIQLSKSNISNLAGDGPGRFGNSSLSFDDTTIFRTELDPTVTPMPLGPGDYIVDYSAGLIKLYTPTPSESALETDSGRKKIRYMYREEYSTKYAVINSGETAFTLSMATNSGKYAPQVGDIIETDYSWNGAGIPIEYTIETFSRANGVIDISKLDEFENTIHINKWDERAIPNVNQTPFPPFFTFNSNAHQVTIMTAQAGDIEPEDRIYFKYSPFYGDVNVSLIPKDLDINTKIIKFIYALKYNKLDVTKVQYLDSDATSPMTSPGFNINGASGKTSQTEVVLYFFAPGATEMLISNYEDFRDKTELDYEPFKEQKLWTLLDGDGDKTVYVTLKYGSITLSDRILTASITLDENSTKGVWVNVPSSDYVYTPSSGILKLPSSFGTADIVINAVENTMPNNIIVNIRTERAKRR